MSTLALVRIEAKLLLALFYVTFCVFLPLVNSVVALLYSVVQNLPALRLAAFYTVQNALSRYHWWR